MRTSNYTFLKLENYLYSKPIKGLQGFGVNYRFTFNGKEKDDEVSGAGNTMGATFWEYDSRLARRWNLDPKPTIGLSHYSCLANSPIMNLDPLGDEVKVKYGGFLGLFKKTATYKDGNFYDNKGGVVNTKNRFFNEMNKSINELNSKEEGKKLVDELALSSEIFTIRRQIGEFDNGSFDPINEKNSANPKKGSGGTIRIGLRHSKDEPLFVTLGHEMGHALSSKRGQNNTSSWFKYVESNGTTTSISKDEQVGMYYENLIRVEHGLPLRNYYVEESKQGPVNETHGLN